MEREPQRAFQYHASLPYATENNEKALSELDVIVSRLDALHAAGAFNNDYIFGTAYSYDAGQATRELMLWMRRKLDLPLNTRVRLTKMFADACFEASEAALISRYGFAACALWKSRAAALLLPKQKGLIDWVKMAQAIKKLVLIRENETASHAEHDSPSSVVMSMALLFRCTVELHEHLEDIFADILSYLSPVNDSFNALVLSAFGALIPYEDPKSAKYQRLLFSLWNLVPTEVATRSILPSVAQFAKVVTLRGWEKPQLTSDQLNVCFQGTLHGLNIPLVSITQSRAKERGEHNRGSRIKGDVIGLNSSAFAQLVVWSIRKDDVRALELLETMVSMLGSFCHPSNLGPWTALIITMLADLANTFIKRVNTEAELGVPETSRISPEIISRFVKILTEPTTLGIHSHAPIVFATSVNLCRILATLAPDMILPRLLGEVYPTLQHGLHQPQRIVTALTCISRTAVPLVATPKYRMHLTTLLELALPSIDANEVRRCLLALALFQSVASVTSFQDRSDDSSVAAAAQVLPEVVHQLEATGSLPDVEPEIYDIVDRGTSAAFPEILTQYMRRIFDLLETTGEAALGSAAPASVMRVLLACSPPIFDRLLQMALVEVLNPQQHANDAFAQVCGTFIRANCALAFPQFWALLTRYIREEIKENQAGSGRSVMTRDRSLLRYLSVLNMCLLAANSQALVEVAPDLKELIALLRAHTNVSVVYTVANTIHHAIAGLVGYSVVLPSPDGLEEEDADVTMTEDEKPLSVDMGVEHHALALKHTNFRNLAWNVPTEASKKVAAELFEEQIERSAKQVREALQDGASTIQSRDVVSSALIFVRTSTGAIAPLALADAVCGSREKVAKFLLDVYPQIGRDDIASLKEILFVAKVWLCDVQYERTARIDNHQESLYNFEKRAFKVPGLKKQYPPTVLARRAQLYHHQRQALATQRRQPSSIDKELVFKILVDACFSAYPAVRRNAFSALYSPLKIFADYDLYATVYRKVLDLIESLLGAKDFERAEGGFGLLTYRSMGSHTVCRDYSQLERYLNLVSVAIATDNFKLSNHATAVFWMLSTSSFKLPIGRDPRKTAAWSSISSLTSYLTKNSLESLHWNQALLRASSLMLLNQNPRLPVDTGALTTFAQGIVGRDVHPDVRVVSTQGLLLVLQRTFRFLLNGYNFEAFKLGCAEDVPADAFASPDDAELVDDWSFFINAAHIVPTKLAKTSPKMRVKKASVGLQGWLIQPTNGLMRVPREGVSSLRINTSDDRELKAAMSFNTSTFWSNLGTLRLLEPRQEEDSLDKFVALLYRDLAALSSLGYGTPLKDVLVNFDVLDVSKDKIDDKNWHRVAAEVTAGLLLALPLISGTSDVEAILDTTTNLLTAVLDGLTPETVEYWISCMTLVIKNVDLRRLDRLLTLLGESARPETSGNGGGIRLALRTALYSEILATASCRLPRLYEVARLWPRWNHDLQATRESASNELAVAISGTLRRVWRDVEEAVTLANMEESGLGQPPIMLSNESVELIKKCFELDVKKVDLSLLHLFRRTLQLIGSDATVAFADHVLALLLRTTSVRDDPETLVLVTALFSTLDMTIYHPTMTDGIAVMMATCAQSEQWHQRIRALLLCQSFFFNHLLVFRPEKRHMFAHAAVGALSDTQVEVRELAADTLSGIVRCSPPSEQETYIDELSSKFECMLARDSSLGDRHAAVLGLGALAGAFPYVSPPPLWLPRILATLAVKAAGDNGIVGKSAKQILGDFKKTRQDTWHIDQKSFTQEQLDDLDGVLWKNYFA